MHKTFSFASFDFVARKIENFSTAVKKLHFNMFECSKKSVKNHGDLTFAKFLISQLFKFKKTL